MWSGIGAQPLRERLLFSLWYGLTTGQDRAESTLLEFILPEAADHRRCVPPSFWPEEATGRGLCALPFTSQGLSIFCPHGCPDRSPSSVSHPMPSVCQPPADSPTKKDDLQGVSPGRRCYCVEGPVPCGLPCQGRRPGTQGHRVNRQVRVGFTSTGPERISSIRCLHVVALNNLPGDPAESATPGPHDLPEPKYPMESRRTPG